MSPERKGVKFISSDTDSKEVSLSSTVEQKEELTASVGKYNSQNSHDNLRKPKREISEDFYERLHNDANKRTEKKYQLEKEMIPSFENPLKSLTQDKNTNILAEKFV